MVSFFAATLSDQWWTWPLFWTWAGKIAKVPGHHINSNVDIEIDGYWKDKDQTMNFTLKAMVTERDTSNAKQNLEQAAKWVSRQKPAILNVLPK